MCYIIVKLLYYDFKYKQEKFILFLLIKLLLILIKQKKEVTEKLQKSALYSCKRFYDFYTR